VGLSRRPVRRWSAEHSRKLQHWADDSKFEQRPVPSFAARRQDESLRYHHRINGAADQQQPLSLDMQNGVSLSGFVLSSGSNACPTTEGLSS
jgi:hypothetical protein